MNVVLVHGWLNSGSIMSGLAAALRMRGHDCLVPTLRPSGGRLGLEALARKLEEEIVARWPDGEPVALVGFSMGAIISRIYLQELAGHRRTKAFFSIAGPHRGTWGAHLWRTQGVREMRPGSPLLARLDASTGVLGNLPVVCYWTPFDLMIRPVASARWLRGESVRVPVLLHSLLPFDRRLHDDVARRLSEPTPQRL